ncbi:MAG: acylphosphatase [Pelolinea sp.]|nr:acylphosphatase [Pelolinea sp.]
MNTGQNERLQIIVEGRVQGIGFRYFIYELGLFFKLTGWVKNKINGNVEILAEGPRDSLEALLGEAKKGPRMAQIVNVIVEWRKPNNDLPPFTIHPTD